MVEVKSPAEVDAMRAAGRVVAAALAAVRERAAVGVSLRELDAVARDVLTDGRRPVHLPRLPAAVRPGRRSRRCSAPA